MTWDATLLAALIIEPEQLSPLADFNESLSGLNRRFAERWPALQEVPWFLAVGDGAAANVGTGCVTSRRVALTVGTTAALRIVTTDRFETIPPGLWCYRVDRRRSLPGGALTEGGSVFAWLTDTLNLGAVSAFEATLAGMEPDAHGLIFFPSWQVSEAQGGQGTRGRQSTDSR
jgi:gluconokinase